MNEQDTANNQAARSMNIESTQAFHIHERRAQLKAGVADRMAMIGERAIRTFMPDQHREFFEQLPMMFIGALDDAGRIWASVFFGEPGFVQSPTETTLRIKSALNELDPLNGQIKAGSDIGLLGIELETRRRNRMNAQVISADSGELSLAVKQSFGNCPKYIQLRDREAIHHESKPQRTEFKLFDERLDGFDVGTFVGMADTFFIASQFDDGIDESNRGVDVSHRGGMPGFIRVEDPSTLMIPDYAGNNFFNTIGNMAANPNVGLLFLDHSTGHQLSLTGKAEAVWASDQKLPFDDVDRMIRFELHQGVVISNVLPFRWKLTEYSPFSRSYEHLIKRPEET